MTNGKGAAEGLPRSAAPDFDHPLEMLSACHDRIQERCDLLHRLIDHLAASGCDEQARQAASNVLRYFDTAGEHHHVDEEGDLFPLLAGKATDDVGALHLIARLRAEHAEMRAAWQALREPLQTIAAGTSAHVDPALSTRFTDLYRRHIQLEESELLPLAARTLDDEDQAALGSAMARRRGVRS